MKCLFALLLLVLGPASAFAQDRVERYGVYEVVLQGGDAGNPLIDLELTATFTRGSECYTPEGFYGGEGTYRIRFMPPSVGEWSWVTRSNHPDLDGKKGSFLSIEGKNKGPVRVDKVHHFAHADMTVTPVPGIFEIGELARYGVADKDKRVVTLPGKPYMALRIQRVGSMPAGPKAPLPGAAADDD